MLRVERVDDYIRLNDEGTPHQQIYFVPELAHAIGEALIAAAKHQGPGDFPGINIDVNGVTSIPAVPAVEETQGEGPHAPSAPSPQSDTPNPPAAEPEHRPVPGRFH